MKFDKNSCDKAYSFRTVSLIFCKQLYDYNVDWFLIETIRQLLHKKEKQNI